MPIRLSDIEKYGAPIYFEKKGEATVRTGPSSGAPWMQKKIPLDGRRYVCAGKVFLKNGVELRANFEIKTYTFDLLDQDSVRIYVEKEKAWYKTDEPELFEILQIDREDAIPYKWIPDIPLDYHDQGPYSMSFYDE